MKKIFFYASILILVIFLIMIVYINKSSYIGINIISNDELNSIISSRNEFDSRVELYYNNQYIPYVNDENYYLFHNKNEFDYKNIYSKYGYTVKVYEDNGDVIKIIIYNRIKYKLSEIKHTIIPIISLNVTKTSGKEKYCYMNIFGGNAENYDIEKYNCVYHIKGATSRTLTTKHQYKLNVLDGKGKKLSVSLLGMKNDDDWILNSLWADNSYIREMLAFELWNHMNDSSYEQNMKYIELVIDDNYEGVYALEEQIELKKLGLNNKSLLVSVKQRHNQIEDHMLYNPSAKFSKYIDEFEIDDGISDNSLKRQILLGFIKNLAGYNEDNNIRYNIENNATYDLLLNMILAVDNDYKNQKLIFKPVDDGYELSKMPWDLDWSMFNERVAVYFDMNKILHDQTIPKEIRVSEEFINYQKGKYFELRKTIYNEEYINKLIDEHINYLKNSGAIERSKAEKKFTNSLPILKDFFKERIKILDEYYGGL